MLVGRNGREDRRDALHVVDEPHVVVPLVLDRKRLDAPRDRMVGKLLELGVPERVDRPERLEVSADPVLQADRPACPWAPRPRNGGRPSRRRVSSTCRLVPGAAACGFFAAAVGRDHDRRRAIQHLSCPAASRSGRPPSPRSAGRSADIRPTAGSRRSTRARHSRGWDCRQRIRSSSFR